MPGNRWRTSRSRRPAKSSKPMKRTTSGIRIPEIGEAEDEHEDDDKP